MYKIIGANNIEYGPVDAATLRQWIAEGRINGHSMAQVQGESGWKPLAQFQEFAALFPTSPASVYTATPMPGPLGSNSGRQHALDALSGPSISLIVVSGLSLVYSLFQLIQVLVTGSEKLEIVMAQIQKQQPANAALMQSYKEIVKYAMYASPVISLLIGAFVLFGAIQMRKLSSYGLSMAAAILAVIPCISPCCVLGIPFAIWALVVLNKPDVRSQFT